jgi:ankyrin repeat protein
MRILAALLLALPIAALAQDGGPPASNSLSAERKALLDEVQGLLEKQDFARLELIADGLRRERARFSSGAWKIETFYLGLKKGRGHLTLQSWPLYRAALERWIDECPKSVTPRIALANAHKSRAWQARGTGYASSVSDEDALEFARGLHDAWQLLSAAEALSTDDPFLYQLMVDVGRASSVPRAQTDAAFARGSARHAGYHPLYQSVAGYMLPRWGGSDGAVADFARTSADRTAASEGNVLYARIAWGIFDGFGPDEFDLHGFDWPRTQAGFADLETRFPGSAMNRNLLCRLACHFDDRALASKLFAAIPSDWNEDLEAVWGARETLAEWRAWAGGKAALVSGDTLHQAAGDGNLTKLRQQLAGGARIDAQDAEGSTPLLHAILQHERGAALFLLDAKADPNIATHKGWTPLHEAVDNMDPELVAALLEHGANPNAASDGAKWTPLHLAAQRGFTEIAALLLERADLDRGACLRNGDTALVQAIRNTRVEAAKLLAKHARTQLEFPHGDNGWTALHYAVHFGDEQIVASLLAAGASVHTRTKSGHTALQVARKNGRDAAIALLKKHGARE